MPRFGRRLLAALVAALVAVGVLVAAGATSGFAAGNADDTPPKVAKTLEDNGDGTYKLTLSVTGTASTSSESSKANVVIVFDTSGSMNYSTGQYTYTPTDEKYGTYGLVDGEYVELNYHRARRGRAEYWTYDWYDTRYEGTRYLRTGGTRLEVAQDATTKLIDQLTANNTDENADAVEISLVNFASEVKGTSNWSTDKDTLDNAVNAYTAGGGTNWEAALKKAQELADAKHKAQPDEETYIIFVSDGNPTFRDSKYNQLANDWNSYYGHYGNGNTDHNGWNFGAAQDVVNSLDSSYHLYTIGAFGDADNMKNLGGTYYDATDEAALNAAFKNILNEITNAVGYKNVQVTDNVTSLTASLVRTDAVDNFTYTKGGQAWTDVPEGAQATFTNGKVSWDLSSLGTLEQGITYTVSFDVWPSQEAMDILADLKNGTKTYDSLTADQKAQIVKSGDGYALKTNTADGNTVAYNKVETTTSTKLPDGVTQNEDGTWTAPDGSKWTQNEDGTYTGTKETPGETKLTNPDPMPLTSSDMTLKKEFENNLDSYAVDSVDLTVTSDGDEYLTKTLAKTDDPAWSANISIAPGIISTTADGGYVVRESGHDFTVTEPPSEYHYDLTVATYHPMIIDGTLTMLQEVPQAGDDTYTINDKHYAKIDGAAAATITATNSRRSNINLTKVVDDKTNGPAPADATFTYTGKVDDATGADVWFSVQDASGKTVEVTTDATPEVRDGANTGYYYVQSGVEFTVALKAGQNLRITNAPADTTWSFTESTDMPKGFAFEKAEGGDVQGQTVSGTVATNSTYTATFTNSYDKVTLSSKTSDALQATKQVTGHDAVEAFNFALTAADKDTQDAIDAGDVVLAGATATTKADLKDGAAETVNFGDVTFYKEGTYKFTIDETTTTTQGGWTYDATTHDVTVTVSKDADGKLTATVAGNNPTFTNTYEASTTIETTAEGTAFLTKEVKADGTAWAPKTFEFSITPAEGAPDPEKTTGTATFNAAGSQVIDFGKITFTKPGAYTYTVKETTTGTNDGWTYDNAEKTVSVEVTDNNDGTLTAKVSGVTITNTYSATGELDTSTTAVLTKTVNADGTAWAPKKFDFEISPVDGAPAPESLTGSATFSAAGSQTVSFGKFKFTKAGTYKYKVKETTASGDGWTCDNAEHEIVITVVDNGNGTLSASVTGAQITNTYSATGELDTSTTAVLTKTVVAEGTAWAPKTFDFTIAAAEDNPAPVTIENENGSATFSEAGTQTISFGKISFTKAGTYTFTVQETTESGNGWTCDNEAKTVTVEVKDNGNGTLTATPQAASITNTYGDFKPLTVADPPVSKVVTGDPAVMPTFEFTMTATDGAPMPEGSANGAKTVSITGAGGVEFGQITFAAPGTYTYKVSETKGGGTGWTNDTQTYTIAYVVTDNGDGTMSATMTVNGAADGKAIFTNSYAAEGELDTTATAVLTKTVESKVDDTAWAPKTFDFTITPAAGNPADVTIENANGSATFSAAGTQTISFGKIAFTKAGTYNFSVAETTQSGNGWTCDTNAKNVEVTVTDKGDGTLVATVTAPADIKNVYDVKPIEGDDAVKLSVTKTLTGNTLAAGQFSFELKDAQGNLLQSKSNAADGTVAFDGLEYTEPGTYKYTISEVNDEKAGYKYDGTPAEVTVTVSDEGDGTMSADVKYGKTTFSNSYEASGDTDGTIYAQKTLEGRKLEADQFKFELKDSEGNVLQTKTNDASGRVIFDAIKYDQSIFGNEPATTDAKADQVAKAEELAAEPENEEKAEAKANAGELVAESDEESAFTEDTEPEANEPVTESADPVDEVTEPKTEEPEVTNPVTNLVNALASLIATPAHAADNPRTKVFTYTISEVNDGKAGYEYDTHVETVTVTVTDKGDGTLAVSTAYDKDGAAFTNKYTATGETGSSVTATKTLTGRDMVEGEFEFALLDAAGNEVATGKNAADGSVTFSSIKYTQDEVGEHEYTMVEKSGSKTGVTYDTAKKPVKVTVTDNGNGTLATAVSYPEGNTFENTYKPLATSGYLTAQKVLNGRELQAGEFSFELLDADGNVIDTQSNAADGTVKFEGLNFDEAGTFTYQVREVKGDEANVTYDEKVATYTVVVEDVDGQLTITSVTADGSDQAAVFTNTYTEPPAPTPEPEQPRRPLPNSGDATPDATPLAMIGLAVLAGGVLLRKRELGK